MATLVTGVPDTRAVNGKPLSSDVTLAATDVGAEPSGTSSAAITQHEAKAGAHSIAGVNGLQAALDSKEASGAAAAAVAAHKSGTDQHSIAGVTGLQAALDGKQAASSVLSAIAQGAMGAFSHRNLLINGDFRVWQRSNLGTNITSANSYTADRWLVSAVGTVSVNINPASARADGRGVLLITGVTAGASATIMQRIEASNVAHLVGKQVTFSVEVQSNAARSCTLYIAKPAGTAKDDWSSSPGGTQVEAKGISVTTAITRFSIAHTVTNDDVKNGISVQVYTGSLAVNDYVALSEAQFEEGVLVTPFERRPYGYELSLCQRYYASATLLGWCLPVLAGSNIRRGVTAFPVQMRVAPTVAITYIGDPIVVQVVRVAGFEYGVDSGTAHTYITSYTASAEL